MCPGCNHIFSLWGYHCHLALTQDPLCHAVFDKLKKANDTYELLRSTKEKSSSGAGSDTGAMLFQGDAFGTAEDYAFDMFGQAMGDDGVQPDNLPPLIEVSDDEDNDKEDDEDDSELANMIAELERSWEPPREGAPCQEAVDQDNNKVDPNDVPPLMDASDDEDDDDEGAPHHHQVDNSDIDDNKSHVQHQRNIDHFIIRDGYGVKPAVRIQYNDKHPSAWAGQPLMHQESRDNVYGAALGGGDNPWAPFNSKKDWEIARWVKLQGAGSTAFLELLAVNGVRFNWISTSNHIMFTHVYLTGPRRPQFVIQKLRRTQLNHQY